MLFLSTFCAAAATPSHLTMPHIYSDHMVIQADTLARLHGQAAPGAAVKAQGCWGAESSATADRNGNWQLLIRTPAPSFDPLKLTVTSSAVGKTPADTLQFSDVLAGEVWLASGQSNMEMPLRGFWNQPIEGGAEEIVFSRTRGKGIRFINVPKSGSYSPQYDFEGEWKVSEPEAAADFSAAAWWFATTLRDLLDRPVGIVSCAYGGSKVEGWMPSDIIARYPDRDMAAEKKDADKPEYERVGVMYNAMLLPVAGYTARGFLWNQGESNVGGHSYYPDRQLDMLRHWRDLWGNPEMPFYFVELPGWEYEGINGTQCALFREAQHRAAGMDLNSHIVSTVDLTYPDEPDDIHARNKRPIGLRLAQSAATFTYGLRGLPYTYPTYRDMTVDGPRATLYFNNAWQGFTPNDTLSGFETAGADRIFRKSPATIDRDHLTIIVENPTGQPIEAVRYCFRNFGPGEIHDMMGMPLLPFRTDNWDDAGSILSFDNSFVGIDPSGNFTLSGKPYRFIGTNLWYAPILASEGKHGDISRLDAELDALQALGINNLRILAGGDGDRYIDSHIWPTLQTAPGVYDPTMLKGLDNLIARLEQRGMKAVVYLNNAWEWSGGYGSYLEWSGHGATPVPLHDGYDTYMRHVARFSTDSTAIAMFHNHVRNIVGRVNSVTGRPYSESPAIMSWQIANEPRCFDPESKEAFIAWIESTAALIKSIDSNHLVSTGSEGSHGCEEDIDLWARIHNSPNIDYANVHIWPYNWGWADPSDLHATLPNAKKNTLEYIENHSRLTKKPIVLEEFGFPRDGMAIAPGSPCSARDSYYKYVFDLVGDGAPLAGINFWGWGGSARPAHRSWQPGDDYCGDPAQEDQGLNSVFDADTSTLDIIRSATSRLGGR